MLNKVCGAFVICICLATSVARAQDDFAPDNFYQVIEDVRDNCIGIADRLSRLQTMAGVNTAVTGVGTLAAGGALIAGVSKYKIDKQVEELEHQLDDIENMSDADFIRFLKNYAEYEETLATYNNICSEKQSLEAKSKKLGNVRTGLMATNTATAIAGTVIAGKNHKDGRTVAEHVSDCLAATDKATQSMGQARITGPDSTYQRLKNISENCGKFYTKNLDKISNNSNVAMISSAVNIGTGVVGTVTSVVANTNSTRNDNSASGKKKEKNLNTTANVFAGLSTAASGVSTVFNALTLKAINDNLKTARLCEEALQ